jgi:hypothetical protein
VSTYRSNPAAPQDFSLVLGGPLYQLFLRCRLTRAPLDLWHRRIVAGALITWLPLLLLSAIAGQTTRGVAVPFLRDLSAHSRFLLAVPLLIVAEVVVHVRIRGIIEQFRERGLIAPDDEAAFSDAIHDAGRWRNAIWVEVGMLVLAFTLGHWIWSRQVALHVPTWYGREEAGGRQLTPAGYWYVFVSLPVFRFLLLRWYFRIAIWYRFLWRVSRLRLRLNPLHPDRAGGLGFLGISTQALVPVLVAHTAALAGVFGNRIWHAGARLPQFKLEIGGIVAGLLLIVFAPLAFFAFQLAAARRAGLRQYGAVASEYVREFERKWIAPAVVGAAGAAASPASSTEPLLGTADIQSLADLGNSFDVVREMRTLPFGKDAVINAAVIILLPLAPLVLTMIPLDQLVDSVFKVLV